MHSSKRVQFHLSQHLLITLHKINICSSHLSSS